jgi:hypothetical protein
MIISNKEYSSIVITDEDDDVWLCAGIKGETLDECAKKIIEIRSK